LPNISYVVTKAKDMSVAAIPKNKPVKIALEKGVEGFGSFI
jgi:hypothetical protein